MEDLKLENSVPTKELLRQLWSTFDVLKEQNISSSEYDIILLLLSLYKDGYISNDTLLGDIHDHLATIVKDSDEQYLAIYKNFESSFKRLSPDGLRDLVGVICNINKAILLSDFAKIFDHVLYQISQSQGIYSGEFIQPIELTRLICSISKLDQVQTVFNPFAGLASFATYLGKDQYYFGQEKNSRTWALGYLRLKAFSRTDHSQFECGDSILDWPETAKFDLILSTPPFGIRLNKEYPDVKSDIHKVEHFLIEEGLKSLNDNGKLITIIPQGLLFSMRSVEQDLRKRLIEEDLVDTIIYLSGGLLQNNGMPLVVLVIDKDKKEPSKVRFIDAKSFVEVKGSRKKLLNDFDLIKIIHSDYEDSEKVRVINNDQIREKNYNLNGLIYFQKKIDGIKVKEVLKLVRGSTVHLSNRGKLIKIKDLKDDMADFSLDISSKIDIEIGRHSSREINESCLLVTTRGRALKPTYFKFEGEPIFLSPYISAFRVNYEIADPIYICSELNDDYVKEQLDLLTTGQIAPSLRIDQLLDLVIKLPSAKEQRAKVQGLLQLSDRLKSLQEEREALMAGEATKEYAEFASLKHTLGTPRQNILDWADNLLHYFNEEPEGFDTLNKSFADIYKVDILFILKQIKKDINFMTEVLESVEEGKDGSILKKNDKTVIPLSDINRQVNELSSHGYSFKIVKYLLQAEGLKARGILGNNTLLKTLIVNVLTNAQKYAFKTKRAGNEVVFELREVDEILSLEVRNNGTPFPKNFNREKFILKFSTADSRKGTGLGGYDIHRIATEFGNPDWELVLNEDPIYPVVFKFEFPIKLIN
ncbi:N-6 DNA methylase [Roseivirga echinicomitans]